MRVGADSAGNLAHTDDRARALDALPIAAELRVPQRELQTECHRLGMHTMGATDHRRVAVLARAGANRL